MLFQKERPRTVESPKRVENFENDKFLIFVMEKTRKSMEINSSWKRVKKTVETSSWNGNYDEETGCNFLITMFD